MKLTAALLGNLEEYMAEELADAEWAVSHAVREGAEDVVFDLRADVVAGGLGSRLARTWHAKHYPENQNSLGAASVIDTKSEKLIKVFDQGATIKSTGGAWIAVPTEHAPKFVGRGKKRISPENFPEHQYGRLRFVPRTNGPSLLVVDNQRKRAGKRGGYTLSHSKRALKTGYGLSTVIMFFLYPQVRLKKRLNVTRVLGGAEGKILRRLDANFRMRDSRGRK
ncbi:DUF6441 family protein [Thalassovita sp.]|uniref:DUF6441 family protein n=1 Tax=Thalassovita sp. TaxID=1979401 RepID=UPI002AB209CC|nr:DUF6441 family protein [Thalassovita sp.]